MGIGMSVRCLIDTYLGSGNGVFSTGMTWDLVVETGRDYLA